MSLYQLLEIYLPKERYQLSDEDIKQILESLFDIMLLETSYLAYNKTPEEKAIIPKIQSQKIVNINNAILHQKDLSTIALLPKGPIIKEFLRKLCEIKLPLSETLGSKGDDINELGEESIAARIIDFCHKLNEYIFRNQIKDIDQAIDLILEDYRNMIFISTEVQMNSDFKLAVLSNFLIQNFSEGTRNEILNIESSLRFIEENQEVLLTALFNKNKVLEYYFNQIYLSPKKITSIFTIYPNLKNCLAFLILIEKFTPGSFLNHASEELRNNELLMQKAIELYPKSIESIGENLRNNENFMLRILSHSKDAKILLHFNAKLKAEPKLMLRALAINPEVRYYIQDSLYMDTKFCMQVLTKIPQSDKLFWLTKLPNTEHDSEAYRVFRDRYQEFFEGNNNNRDQFIKEAINFINKFYAEQSKRKFFPEQEKESDYFDSATIIKDFPLFLKIPELLLALVKKDSSIVHYLCNNTNIYHFDGKLRLFNSINEFMKQETNPLKLKEFETSLRTILQNIFKDQHASFYHTILKSLIRHHFKIIHQIIETDPLLIENLWEYLDSEQKIALLDKIIKIEFSILERVDHNQYKQEELLLLKAVFFTDLLRDVSVNDTFDKELCQLIEENLTIIKQILMVNPAFIKDLLICDTDFILTLIGELIYEDYKHIIPIIVEHIEDRDDYVEIYNETIKILEDLKYDVSSAEDEITKSESNQSLSGLTSEGSLSNSVSDGSLSGLSSVGQTTSQSQSSSEIEFKKSNKENNQSPLRPRKTEFNSYKTKPLSNKTNTNKKSFVSPDQDRIDSPPTLLRG